MLSVQEGSDGGTRCTPPSSVDWHATDGRIPRRSTCARTSNLARHHSARALPVDDRRSTCSAARCTSGLFRPVCRPKQQASCFNRVRRHSGAKATAAPRGSRHTKFSPLWRRAVQPTGSSGAPGPVWLSSPWASKCDRFGLTQHRPARCSPERRKALGLLATGCKVKGRRLTLDVPQVSKD